MISASPELAFVAGGAGVLLMYLELCAPGRVVPGCAGAVLALGGGWSVWIRHETIALAVWVPVVLIIACTTTILGRLAYLGRRRKRDLAR